MQITATVQAVATEDDGPEWLTTAEAARLLRVSTAVLLRAVELGQVGALELGDRRQRRFHREALVERARCVHGGCPRHVPPPVPEAAAAE